jgi:hypothetical protein
LLSTGSSPVYHYLLEQELPNNAHNDTAAEKSQFNIRWKVTVVAAPLCQRRELTEKEQQFVRQFRLQSAHGVETICFQSAHGVDRTVPHQQTHRLTRAAALCNQRTRCTLQDTYDAKTAGGE